MRSKTTSLKLGIAPEKVLSPEVPTAKQFVPDIPSIFARTALLVTTILALGMGDGKTDEDGYADLPADSRALLEKLEELHQAELHAVEEKYKGWCKSLIPKLEQQLDDATRQKDLKGALAIDKLIKELKGKIEPSGENSQSSLGTGSSERHSSPDQDSEFQELLNLKWSHRSFGLNSFVFTPDEKSGFKIHKGDTIPMKVSIKDTDKKNEFLISTIAHSARQDFLFKASKGELWTADASGKPVVECESSPWKADLTQ